MKKKKPGCH